MYCLGVELEGSNTGIFTIVDKDSIHYNQIDNLPSRVLR